MEDIIRILQDGLSPEESKRLRDVLGAESTQEKELKAITETVRGKGFTRCPDRWALVAAERTLRRIEKKKITNDQVPSFGSLSKEVVDYLIKHYFWLERLLCRMDLHCENALMSFDHLRKALKKLFDDRKLNNSDQFVRETIEILLEVIRLAETSEASLQSIQSLLEKHYELTPTYGFTWIGNQGAQAQVNVLLGSRDQTFQQLGALQRLSRQIAESKSCQEQAVAKFTEYLGETKTLAEEQLHSLKNTMKDAFPVNFRQKRFRVRSILLAAATDIINQIFKTSKTSKPKPELQNLIEFALPPLLKSYSDKAVSEASAREKYALFLLKQRLDPDSKVSDEKYTRLKTDLRKLLARKLNRSGSAQLNRNEETSLVELPDVSETDLDQIVDEALALLADDIYQEEEEKIINAFRIQDLTAYARGMARILFHKHLARKKAEKVISPSARTTKLRLLGQNEKKKLRRQLEQKTLRQCYLKCVQVVPKERRRELVWWFYHFTDRFRLIEHQREHLRTELNQKRAQNKEPELSPNALRIQVHRTTLDVMESGCYKDCWKENRKFFEETDQIPVTRLSRSELSDLIDRLTDEFRDMIELDTEVLESFFDEDEQEDTEL